MAPQCDVQMNLGIHPVIQAREIRNRTSSLQDSQALLKSQALGTSLFTSDASKQGACLNCCPGKVHVRLPEVRGGRVAVKSGVVSRA